MQQQAARSTFNNGAKAVLRSRVWLDCVGDTLATTPCFGCGETRLACHYSGWECGHVISLSRGGATKIGNLVPICRSCNGSMGDENMIQWMAANDKRGSFLMHAWLRTWYLPPTPHAGTLVTHKKVTEAMSLHARIAAQGVEAEHAHIPLSTLEWTEVQARAHVTEASALAAKTAKALLVVGASSGAASGWRSQPLGGDASSSPLAAPCAPPTSPPTTTTAPPPSKRAKLVCYESDDDDGDSEKGDVGATIVASEAAADCSALAYPSRALEPQDPASPSPISAHQGSAATTSTTDATRGAHSTARKVVAWNGTLKKEWPSIGSAVKGIHASRKSIMRSAAQKRPLNHVKSLASGWQFSFE